MQRLEYYNNNVQIPVVRAYLSTVQKFDENITALRKLRKIILYRGYGFEVYAYIYLLYFILRSAHFCFSLIFYSSREKYFFNVMNLMLLY